MKLRWFQSFNTFKTRTHHEVHEGHEGRERDGCWSSGVLEYWGSNPSLQYSSDYVVLSVVPLRELWSFVVSPLF